MPVELDGLLSIEDSINLLQCSLLKVLSQPHVLLPLVPSERRKDFEQLLEIVRARITLADCTALLESVIEEELVSDDSDQEHGAKTQISGFDEEVCDEEESSSEDQEDHIFDA